MAFELGFQNLKLPQSFGELRILGSDARGGHGGIKAAQ
jgi:hypothetical protein